jgi:hypothetical protein
VIIALTIDPGIDGAYCTRSRVLGEELIETFPMDLDRINSIVASGRLFPVIIEKLTGTGTYSPFTLALNYGEILGVMRTHSRNPLLIPPQVWQRPWSAPLSNTTYAKRKKILWDLAKDTHPTIPKPQADALMIMRWWSTFGVGRASMSEYFRHQ